MSGLPVADASSLRCGLLRIREDCRRMGDEGEGEKRKGEEERIYENGRWADQAEERKRGREARRDGKTEEEKGNGEERMGGELHKLLTISRERERERQRERERERDGAI